MHPLLRVSLFALLTGGVLLVSELDAQTGDSKGQPDPAKTAGETKDPAPKKIPLDKFKMPAGSTVILVEPGKDFKSYFPSMVIMTPAQHQDLMDRIANLEKSAKADRKTAHTCKLSAVVEGDNVRIVADLYFQTDQPKTNVLAGFRGAPLSEAKMRAQGGKGAWQQAVVDVGPDGYVVHVDKAGDYQMVVEMRVPLTAVAPGTPAPGAERSFDLILPGAAVTTLNLELPEAVKELRWNKSNIEKPTPPAAEQKRWDIAVGKVTQLQVAWKEPLTPGGKTPLQTARGQITTRFDANQVTTTAELTLTDLRGKAKEWRLWLPAQAKPKAVSPEGMILKTVPGNPYLHILTLPAPTADPIKVIVTQTFSRAKNPKIVVGPFAVQDAVEQKGTIEVKVQPDVRKSLRLTYQHGGSVEVQPPPRDQPGNEVVAVFKYSNMPVPPKNATAADAKKILAAAPLEIDPHTIQGKVDTQVEHTLKLRPSEHGWQIAATCKIIARPSSEAAVDFLDVQLPAVPREAWPLLMEPSMAGFPAVAMWAMWGLGNQVAVDGEWMVAGNAATNVELTYVDDVAKAQRKVRLKWTQPQTKDFTVTLEGRYYLPSNMHKVRLELPRPLGVIDRGAKGSMTVGEMFELLSLDGGPEVPLPEKYAVTRTWDRAADAYWELAWRPRRAEFPIQVTTDISFWPEHAHAKTQLTWDQADRARNPGGKPTPMRLRVPAEAKNLRVAGAGKLTQMDRDKGLAWVETADVAGKNSVVLEYDFALPTGEKNKAGTPFPAVLLWLEQATRVDTKVRLWGHPGMQPALAPAAAPDLTWTDVGTEVVPGRDSLPAHVLLSKAQNPLLMLRLEAAPAQLATAVIDRVLVQVLVDEEATEQYRARFLLTKLHATTLDVRMPLPLANLDPKFVLDGKAVSWQPRDNTGLVAKLIIDPNLYGRPVVLEVTYQLPRGQPTREGLWHTTLHPPVLDGDVFLGKVRWQVTLASSQLAVAARGDATTDQEWQWRGWLPALAPGLTTNDLELWLTGQELTDLGPEASLVSGRASLEPLRVFRVPKAMWFLICSGTVLLVGFLIYVFPPPPTGWLALVAIALAGVATTGWLWPTILPAVIYGAAPGLLVLGVLLLLQWLMHERYKRQLLFLPGFTRVKTAALLPKANGVQRGREASTIDAPPGLLNSKLAPPAT